MKTATKANLPEAPAFGAIARMSDAEQAFIARNAVIDEFLETQFVPKTELGQSGTAFDILKVADRQRVNEETGETEDQWMLLVLFPNGATLRQRNSRKAVTFAPGGRGVLSLGKNSITNERIKTVQDILKTHGVVPNMALKELRSKNSLHNNPFSLCHVSTWRALEPA